MVKDKLKIRSTRVCSEELEGLVEERGEKKIGNIIHKSGISFWLDTHAFPIVIQNLVDNEMIQYAIFDGKTFSKVLYLLEYIGKKPSELDNEDKFKYKEHVFVSYQPNDARPAILTVLKKLGFKRERG